ncbi:hypothetical protein DWS18_16270 [Escherichia coli]|nr:hypothetical protein [Escherichia coli]EFO1528624.1 hypothetical protein [Escherichia coli]EFO2707377.1 hypothetical protein [Escherichia coli]EFO3171343.1 hypothetical protein [Escherichia coli]KIE75895.1 hypothetical protein GT42_17950 [Escherichia coli]
MADKVYLKYTLSDYSFNLGKNASGIVFNQTAPPEEGTEEKTINSSRGRQHTGVYPALAGNTDTAMFHL